jgi:peptide/nickel transport system ATP-binding protein
MLSSGSRLLQIRDLTIVYPGQRADVTAVESVELDIDEGEILALVGESGSGKTACCLSVLGLLDASARVTGSIRYGGTELVGSGVETLARLRGREIAMIFQDPTGSLNPVRSIGGQLTEMARRGKTQGGKAQDDKPWSSSPRAAWANAIALLRATNVSDPEQRMRQYPHELSGGLAQRVMIGMMLTHRPRLLIADEPTTALDMTTQKQALAMLAELRAEHRMAILLVTHDLGIVAEISDRVAVMREGRIVESGKTAQILSSPRHPYTASLVRNRLDLERVATRPLAAASPPILRLVDIWKSFSVDRGEAWGRRRSLSVVKGASLEIGGGQAFGLVGESGSGKSTLARIAAAIDAPDKGEIVYGTGLGPRERRAVHRLVQYVPQDPAGALDPRMRIGDQLREPLDIHAIGTAAERERRCGTMLEAVGLGPEMSKRFPHELSGGQRQRVVLARALMLEPKILVCDEILASLDVVTQAQIVDLLEELRAKFGLSLLFISHDLSQVRRLCEQIAVMYLGSIVEAGPSEVVFSRPRHPYTEGLIAAIPRLAAPRIEAQTALLGDPPSFLHPPSGCAFHPRCPAASAICRSERPPMRVLRDGRSAACHLAEEAA